MKSIFKKIIVWVLTLEARAVLWKYKPKIVAITGSVGKTSAKDAIFSVISNEFFTRKSEKSFNSELGVPLTILGCPNGWYNPIQWTQNILQGVKLLVMKSRYPEWLILEVGADRPGDIARIGRWLKPDVAVVTYVGAKIPAHVEFFKNPEELFEEKKKLVYALKPTGTLILNHDDRIAFGFRRIFSGNIISYGFNEHAAIRALNDEFVYQKTPEAGVRGIGFKIEADGNVIPVMLQNILGRQHIYAALAGFAVGVLHGINPVKISQALQQYETPPGRMRLVPGKKETLIIDDTYNASPVAVEAALDAMLRIEASGRKIAVLGDMLELGQYSGDAHRTIGEKVGACVDILVTVGIRAKMIAHSAQEHGFKKRSIKSFTDLDEACSWLSKNIKKGDLVLIKGSQGMRMERIVALLLADSAEASRLLVRQDAEWKKRV